MPPVSTLADRLLEGDRAVAAGLAAGLLKPQRDNLVERPWGGSRLCEFKGLTASPCATGRTLGESFELSADDGDDEARLHPSVVVLADGSTITLPALLAVHAETMLGADFIERYGRRFPLLPKLLDVAELLSVQAHPPGNTEVYVIVEADPGATIRLGFAVDVDAIGWAEKLADGRRDQQRLLEMFGPEFAAELQAVLKPWLARPGAGPSELEAALRPRLEDDRRWSEVEARLATLHGCFWAVLDSLNAVPVKAGDVIYNANPPRVVAATGKPISAEVHALGNTEGHNVFALEIRRPGTTFRAWDNVRFPLRDIDIDGGARCIEPHGHRACGLHRRAATRAPRRAPLRRLRILSARASRADAAACDRRACGAAALLARARGPRQRDAQRRRVVGHARARRVGARARAVGAYRLVAAGGPAALVKVDLPPYVD